MGNPVVHFEITSKDAVKARKLYIDLFGWKVNADNPMNYGFVDTDANSEGIGGGMGEGDKAGLTIFVQVPDVQAALDKAVALGGTVVQPVNEIPGMVTLAEFADPEGNRVGLVRNA